MVAAPNAIGYVSRMTNTPNYPADWNAPTTDPTGGAQTGGPANTGTGTAGTNSGGRTSGRRVGESSGSHSVGGVGSLGAAGFHTTGPTLGSGIYTGGQQFPPAPPARSRRPLIIGGALAAVLIVAIAGFVLLRSPSDGPADAVRAYLNAVKSGEADKAKSYLYNVPADSPFLTQDVLDRQLELGAISDISVTDSLVAGSTAGVPFQVKVGDQLVGDTVTVVRNSSGNWKLSDTGQIIEVFVSGDEDLPYAMLGVKVASQEGISMFPALISVGLTEPRAELTVNPQGAFNRIGRQAGITLEAVLSENGTRLAEEAFARYYDACMTAKDDTCRPSIAPPTDAEVLTDSVRWSWSGTDVKFEYTSYDSAIKADGSVVFAVDFDVKQTDGAVVHRQSTGSRYVFGSVDFSVDPPVYNP